MILETNRWNKAVRIPYIDTKACGYQPRSIRLSLPKSIIVHTTNGKKGSSLESEARFIANSKDISAHYLIGKGGEIIQFLDPNHYIAYHAGCVKSMLWSNVYAIGIELHNTPAEGHITDAQMGSLDKLVRLLMQAFHIPHYNIETHRNVAVFCKNEPNAGKLGRKIDPSGFSDNEFRLWRDSLRTLHTFVPMAIEEVTIPRVQYRVTNVKGVNIRQSPQVNDHNIAGTLVYGDTFYGGDIKKDEKGEYLRNRNEWVHIQEGTSRGKDVSQLGFVHISNLKVIT